MLHSSITNPETGKIYFFLKTQKPNPALYLKCGMKYSKNSVSSEIYNLFPIDIESKAKDIFPIMSSNTAPSPYIAEASSKYTASTGSNGVTWEPYWTFINTTNSTGNYSRVYAWTPSVAGRTNSWISYRGWTNKLYFAAYYMNFTVPSGLWAVTTSAIPKTWDVYVTLNSTNEEIKVDTISDNTSITRTCTIPQFTRDSIKKIRFAFKENVTLQRLRLYTVSEIDYNDSIENFIVPEFTSALYPGYDAYVYIGTSNMTDRYSGSTFIPPVKSLSN